MKSLYIIFVAIPLLTVNVYAQKAPIKFGDVSLEELEMKTYPPDTSAPAVVLCDYGYFYSKTLKFSRILRIKILKKEGYTWANYLFPATLRSQVRGLTSNLENGKIVQEKLKSESIFSERVTNDKYRMRVAMPGVRTGSVIDLQITMEFIPSEWKFQDRIPVKYSEVNIDWNTGFFYSQIFLR